MYDLKRTHFSLSLQKGVAAGQVIEREGVCLRSILEAGEEKVQKADGSASTYGISGFAVSDNEDIGVIPAVEDLTVPASPGPYTVDLKRNNLVGTAPNSSVRVLDVTASADLTESNSSPASGEFQPDVSTGILTFHVDEAGHSLRVYYRANLTVAESRQIYFQRNINNAAGAFYNTVVVGMGVGEIYTAEYDTDVDWSTGFPAAANPILSGPDGILTIGGGGTAIPGGKVVHVPDPDNPFLGIAFSIPG